jgi:hypothetical protein
MQHTLDLSVLEEVLLLVGLLNLHHKSLSRQLQRSVFRRYTHLLSHGEELT